MNRILHTKEDYERAMKLLQKYNDCGKVGKVMGIPRTTIRNWKLNYSYPPGSSKRISEKQLQLPRIKTLVKKGKTVPEISKELELPYNTTLLIVKKYFRETYEETLKRKFHKLTDSQRNMTPEFAYILGVMFGDGYNYGRNKAHATGLGVIDKDFRDKFAEIIEKWSGKPPYLAEYIKRGRRYFICLLYSKAVGEFILSYRNLRCVPPEVLNAKEKGIKIMFIRGFADSEGYVGKYVIKISNKNTRLLMEIKDMLISLGFDSNGLRIRKCTTNGVYELDISRKRNIKLYKENVGFSIRRKQEKIGAVPGI